MNAALIIPAIRQVIEQIEPGHIFDSHFVIAMLIRDHSNEYIRFAASFPQAGFTTENMHSHLSKQIPLCGIPVIRQQPQAWSVNIHGIAGPCACWRKTP